MKFDGIKYERRDVEREAQYEEKYLSNCRDVKTYKMTADEIEAKYGKVKNGEKVSPTFKVTIPRPTQEDESMIYKSKEECIDAVQKLMDRLGYTEHIPGASDISKYMKSYEKSIYANLGGVSGIANEFGLPTLGEHNKAQKKNQLVKTKMTPIVEVMKIEISAPEVMTMTSEPLAESINNEHDVKNCDCKVLDEYEKRVAEYDHIGIMINDCVKTEKDLRSRQDELNIWMEGFEKAAELMGVDLG